MNYIIILLLLLLNGVKGELKTSLSKGYTLYGFYKT